MDESKSPQPSPTEKSDREQKAQPEASRRRRGPPIGYAMGPAGGAVGAPDSGRRYGGRGERSLQRRRDVATGADSNNVSQLCHEVNPLNARQQTNLCLSTFISKQPESEETRGTKRSRSASMTSSTGDHDDSSFQGRGRGGRFGRDGGRFGRDSYRGRGRDSRDYGRGPYRGGGGGGRGRRDDSGGRGRWDDGSGRGRWG